MHLIVDMQASKPGCTGKLWLGGERASQDANLLEENRIQVVLPACRKPPPVETFNCSVLPYVDGAGLANGDVPLAEFLKVSDHVFECLQDGAGVLVCCRNGAHRSATLVTAICMRMFSMSFQEAQTHVTTLRNIVDLNSVAPPSAHRMQPRRPSEFLRVAEPQLLAGAWGLTPCKIMSPVAYKQACLDLGFQVAAARPKARPRGGFSTGGESSFEFVGSSTYESEWAPPSAADADSAHSSLSSTESTKRFKKGQERLVLQERDYTMVEDELRTRDARLSKLKHLCVLTTWRTCRVSS